MKIHPEFDGSVWFYDGHEAPTVRALLALLPRGTRVANYYPRGYGAPVVIRKPREEEPRPTFQLKPQYNPNRLYPLSLSPKLDGKWTQENVAYAMLQRTRGVTYNAIGAELGFSRNAVIGKLIREKQKLEKQTHDER